MDLRSGRPMNPNLGEYYVPVNADAPSLEAERGHDRRNTAISGKMWTMQMGDLSCGPSKRCDQTQNTDKTSFVAMHWGRRVGC